MESRLYFISADMEGVTDVTAWCETEPGGHGYERACEQMSREVAAACEAILAAGHRAVVRDAHETARNIRHELLPREVKLIRGWSCDPASMMAGLDEQYAGALYIGYHSPAGTNTSPLAHTMNYATVRWMKINGALASEFTMNSLYAAALGVPSIYISGDEGICRMAAAENPGITATAVKTCSGDATCSMHPADACDRIRADVAEALKQQVSLRPLCEVYQVEVSLASHQAAKRALTALPVTLKDEHTVQYTAHSPREINAMFDLVRAGA